MESRLFEIKGGKGKAWRRLYAGSMLLGLLFIWVYRVSYVPEAGEKGRWAWMAMFAAELWFSFYWLITLSVRWNPIYRCTYKDRLSQRYEEKLPMVDVFICTADPIIEPPIIVINTVLSVLAYDYPLEKLSVYLSDDGGSIFTFYALLEASKFAKSWIPFSRKFNLKHMSPALLFKKSSIQGHDSSFLEWIAMEKLYKEMESRINAAIKLGSISKEIRKEHEGFLEWSSKTTSKNHQAIVKVLIDGRDQNARDSEGFTMPTIIYMAREKHPKYRHNFKAGALNALLRVSEQISNGPIILTIDCDMCANNTESIRDALCIFMDEERGHEYAFVQFPQTYENTTKHDLYASSLKSILHVDLPGLDGQGGPLYIGSCCFHMRDCLNGIKYNEFSNIDLRWERPQITEASISILEERTKNLATCSYEENTQWGKEMGLKYGCPVEDVITGFAIQCRGWKSAYLCPKREAFLGLAPITLSQALIQHKRWSDGHLQIFLTKYCPFFYGFRRTKLGLQMGYCIYSLWAINSIPTLIYVVIPSICLLNEVSVFPNATVLEAASHLLMFREWPVNCPRFMDGLGDARLDCVPQLQYIKLDHYLLIALVERWLPQTNIFHFAVGEMTVTLQNVAMILGVRIDGPHIIKPTVIGEGRQCLSWPDCCDELIGRHPEPNVVYHDPVQPHVTSTFRMGQAHARTCLPLH